MKGFLIGCGVVALLLIGVVTIGGFWAWNQFGPQITQGVQSIQKIQTEIQKVAPNIADLNFNIATVNGKSTARVSAAVPFDPTVGDQPAKVANDVLRVIRQNLPADALPAKTLEIRLYRSRSSSGGSKTVQERTFTFDLTKPLPAPVTPKS
jgi:predicted PurR-regulated permease PerM